MEKLSPVINEILGDKIAATSNELLDIIDTFDPGSFNVIPFPGSWTPAQVCEHIQKAAGGGLHALQGGSEDTTRDPAMNVRLFEEIFLNFDTKMKSPDFILPSDDPHDPTAMKHHLGEIFDGIHAAAARMDLSKTCTDFQFPNIGKVTRLELISFLDVHTVRHIHQLKKMAD